MLQCLCVVCCLAVAFLYGGTALAEPVAAKPVERATNAVVEGQFLTGIYKVRATASGRVAIIHNDGVMSVKATKLSTLFLLGWGIDPTTLKAVETEKQAAEAVTHNNLPDVRPDASFDAWKEIWSQFPLLSVEKLRREPQKHGSGLIRISGVLGHIYEGKEERAFEVMDSGQRMIVVFDAVDELALTRKFVREKLEALKKQPQNGTRQLEVVGELFMTESGQPLLAMVDYTLSQP